MNQRNECKYYEGCSAPICPNLSDARNSDYIWYPDEEICQKKQNLPHWVKQQKKIANKAKSENYCYYFTFAMLKVPFRVASSVKGLDPDNFNENAQLKSWSKRNKGTKKRMISKEQKEQKRKTAALARLAKQQKGSGASISTTGV